MNLLMTPADRLMDRYFLRSLRLSIIGSRGGLMRARILRQLITKPINTQMLADALQIDYKTALYHVEKMQKEGWLLKQGNDYGATYKITFTPEQLAAFDKLVQELGESLKPSVKGVD